MKRKTYAGIEKKTHPDSDKRVFDLVQETPVLTLEESVRNDQHEKAINEILDFLQNIGFNFIDGTGEWFWLQNNRQKNYIGILRDRDKSLLGPHLQSMFRNDVTYGLLSPSFSDVKNDLNQIKANILLDIDTCFEFTDLSNEQQLATSIQIGHPFGLINEEGIILPDTARHFYYGYKVSKLLDISRPVILEIGGGYGGFLSEFWSRRYGNCMLINVDLVPSLVAAFYFLRMKNIPVKFVYSDIELEANFVNLIYSAHIKNFKALFKIPDMIFNSRSLCEMDEATTARYIELINFGAPKYFYHENSNFLLFPESQRHLEIIAGEFKIDSNKFAKISESITPFLGGDGRYREYIYKRIST